MFQTRLDKVYESFFLVGGRMGMANAVLYARLFCGKQTHKRQRRHMRVHYVVSLAPETFAQKPHALEERKHGRKIENSAAARFYFLVERRRTVGVEIELDFGRVDMPKIIHNAVYNAARFSVAYNLRYFDFFPFGIRHFVLSIINRRVRVF